LLAVYDYTNFAMVLLTHRLHLQIDDSDRAARKSIHMSALTGAELSALPEDTPVYKAAGKA
jgi:chaperonin cofactor prefoldin